MLPLGLADDVYFAASEGQGIFLDLRRDDYAAIPLLHDADHDDAAASRAMIAASLEAFRRDLLEAGLVTDNGPGSRDLLAYQRIARPASHVLHPDDQRAFGLTGERGNGPRVRASDLFDFWSASRAAARALAVEHIHETVKRIRSGKADARHASPHDLRRHVMIFRKLRPWYPRPYRCLFDALALVEFLARRNVAVDWVFGVQTRPFGAHCWLQVGGMLLNESTEYASQFTPIMVV